jgi:hypothetical protein
MSAEALREILARGLADGAPGAAGPGPPRG